MKKLTDEVMDQKLFGLNIQRVGNYINFNTKISFQCLDNNCNYVWETIPHNIISRGTGCPQCAGKLPLNNNIVDQKLINRNIKRIDNYINNKTKIRFECLKENCNFIWLAKPHHVLNIESGCPKCSGIMKLTNEVVDQRLVGRNIKRIEEYDGNKKPIKFQCLEDGCDCIWMGWPCGVLNAETGRPNCAFRKNETIVFNVLKSNFPEIECQKSIKKIIPDETEHLIVDFYFSNKNTIIEYNGNQHYHPVRFGGIDIGWAENNFEKQKKRDLYLENFCNANNIKLIWIDGRKYFNSKLEKYVLDFLIPEINGDVK